MKNCFNFLISLLSFAIWISATATYAQIKYEIPQFIDPSDSNYLVIYKKLNPRGSFLNLGPGDPAPDPAFSYIGTYIADPLVQLNFLDTIEYEIVGDYSKGSGFLDSYGDTIGAIYADDRTVCMKPYHDTPVKEMLGPLSAAKDPDGDFDFELKKNTLNKAQLPVGAVYNGFMAADEFFGDNTDPNQNFGVYIRFKKRFPVNNFNNLNYDTGSMSTTGFEVIPSPLKPFKN